MCPTDLPPPENRRPMLRNRREEIDLEAGRGGGEDQREFPAIRPTCTPLFFLGLVLQHKVLVLMFVLLVQLMIGVSTLAILVSQSPAVDPALPSTSAIFEHLKDDVQNTLDHMRDEMRQTVRRTVKNALFPKDNKTLSVVGQLAQHMAVYLTPPPPPTGHKSQFAEYEMEQTVAPPGEVEGEAGVTSG